MLDLSPWSDLSDQPPSSSVLCSSRHVQCASMPLPCLTAYLTQAHSCQGWGKKKLHPHSFYGACLHPQSWYPALVPAFYLFRQWETLNKLPFCTPGPLLPLHPAYHAATGPLDICRKKEAFPNHWFLVTWILIPGTVLSEKEESAASLGLMPLYSCLTRRQLWVSFLLFLVRSFLF